MPELSSSTRVGVVGLGYVGLPLALLCSEHYTTCGFDLSHDRVEALRIRKDHTGEVDPNDFKSDHNPYFTSNVEELRGCDIFLVTVPTPIDSDNNPDLSLLQRASSDVGGVIEKRATVVFESTVYPGATEEVCVPLIERASGLRLNQDFWVGYSPERINPGDKSHRLRDIVKVTSGSNPEAATFIDGFYRSLIRAGTHRAPNIRVAEAAKVIENIQRDLNIALMNEFSQLFNELELDTVEVLDAASTKWNFLPFKPGLVGGHCVGVDPYYLTYKARDIGFDPEVILAGRKINNSMARYVAWRIKTLLTNVGKEPKGAEVLVLGITFKENCPDTRNSKTIDVVRLLLAEGMSVDVCDPLASKVGSDLPEDIELNDFNPNKSYDAVVLAVAHAEFQAPEFESFLSSQAANTVLFDVQQVLPKSLITERL